MQERRTLIAYLNENEIPSSATEVAAGATGNVLYVPVYCGSCSSADGLDIYVTKDNNTYILPYAYSNVLGFGYGISNGSTKQINLGIDRNNSLYATGIHHINDSNQDNKRPFFILGATGSWLTYEGDFYDDGHYYANNWIDSGFKGYDKITFHDGTTGQLNISINSIGTSFSDHPIYIDTE